jgi:hypothetical protein
MFIKLFRDNKLECLSLASLSILVQYLWVRPGAYPRAEHLNVGSMGLAQALLKKIRLGWKGLQWINTIAYHEHS